MKRFSSIEQFRHVVKTVRQKYDFLQQPTPVLNFTGTVKLHGTSGGITRYNGNFAAQSRERELTVNDDNFGFAKFVESLPKDQVNKLFDMISPCTDITIFGEWIGEGINKNVAVSKLPKQFVIFNVWDNVSNKYLSNNINWKNESIGIFNILDVENYSVTIDFANPQDVVQTLEDITLKVEQECPWGKRFGVFGIGEGVVWVNSEHPEDSDLWFKVKGEKHGNKGGKEKKSHLTSIAPEKLNNIREVVDYVLPEWRLAQGIMKLREEGIEVSVKNTGAYLKWIGQDIKKEESDTIESNGLEWKDVTTAITAKARDYFLAECNKF